jgi:hypothetical protein
MLKDLDYNQSTSHGFLMLLPKVIMSVAVTK